MLVVAGVTARIRPGLPVAVMGAHLTMLGAVVGRLTGAMLGCSACAVIGGPVVVVVHTPGEYYTTRRELARG